MNMDMRVEGFMTSRQRIGTMNFRECINSLLVMFIVCESMLNTIMVSIFPIDNLLGYIMLLLGVTTLVLQPIRVDKKIVLVVLFCFISFGFSWARGYMADSLLYLIQFLSFGMIGIVGARLKCNPVAIYKGAAIVSEIFVIMNLVNWNLIESDFNFGYAIIPGVLSFLFLIYNSKKEKRKDKVLVYFLAAVPVFLMFILRSSRGNMAQIIIFLLLGMFFLFGQKKLTVLFGVAGLGIVANFTDILTFLYKWTTEKGINISIIWKTYYLLNTTGQDFSHGRSELFDIVKENAGVGTFAFGNGIGAYEHVAGTYPHNIFLSSYCDFGILGVLFILFLLYKFFKVLKENQNDVDLQHKEFILLIFTLSFVKLCFSGVYWNSSTFWYLVSYLV